MILRPARGAIRVCHVCKWMVAVFSFQMERPRGGGDEYRPSQTAQGQTISDEFDY